MQTIALFIDLYFPQLIVNKFSYCLQRKNMLVYTMYNLVLSTYKYARQHSNMLSFLCNL